MKNSIFLTAAIVFVSCANLFSQSIFSEKFEGCNTNEFALEMETTTAKIRSGQLVNVLTSGFNKDIEEEVRGDLSLQIIVDEKGKSCLLSIQNKTNIETGKLNLKKTIDNKLVWNMPSKRVAAIVLLRFDEKEIKFKRLGMNAGTGFHELKD